MASSQHSIEIETEYDLLNALYFVTNGRFISEIALPIEEMYFIARL